MLGVPVGSSQLGCQSWWQVAKKALFQPCQAVIRAGNLLVNYFREDKMHRSREIRVCCNDLSPSRTASVCSLNGGFGEQRSREDTQLRPGRCDVLTGGDASL